MTAYGIMYPHMNTVVIPYNLYYGVSASLTALLCTMGATWFSCYKELREQAAELMRPPAPKRENEYFGEDSIFVESVQFYLEGDDSESAAL